MMILFEKEIIQKLGKKKRRKERKKKNGKESSIIQRFVIFLQIQFELVGDRNCPKMKLNWKLVYCYHVYTKLDLHYVELKSKTENVYEMMKGFEYFLWKQDNAFHTCKSTIHSTMSNTFYQQNVFFSSCLSLSSFRVVYLLFLPSTFSRLSKWICVARLSWLSNNQYDIWSRINVARLALFFFSLNNIIFFVTLFDVYIYHYDYLK